MSVFYYEQKLYQTMENKREYACLFSDSPDRFYLIDCDFEKISLNWRDITSLFLIFDKYEFILTINSYTTLFKKMYFYNDEMKKYINQYKNYFYLNIRNNVIDLSLYANTYSKTKWFTQLMDSYEQDKPYGIDILEELAAIRQMAHVHPYYRKGEYIYNMLLYPEDFCKSIFIQYPICLETEPIKVDIGQNNMWKRQPVIDKTIVVWYTYPVKYNFLKSCDVFERFIHDGLLDIVEKMMKIALKSVPDTKTYVDTLYSLAFLMDEIVGIGNDYIVTVETEPNFRERTNNLFGINMFVKKIYKHFWQLNSKSWIGIDENDCVDMYGFSSAYVNTYMKKYFYENILHREYPKLDFPRYHITSTPYFTSQNDWKTAKLGYSIVSYNESDYVRYNMMFDINYFLLPKYADPKEFYNRIQRAFLEICAKTSYKFITLKRDIRYEYFLQCEPCYKVQTILNELSSDVCDHSFSENFMMINGHFSFGYYSDTNIQNMCDLCKCLYSLKDHCCYYNTYKDFDKKALESKLVLRGTYVQDQARVCLEKVMHPHQLVSTLVLRQGSLVPLVLIQNKTIDYASLLMLEGFLPDKYFNMQQLVPKTIVHCEGYGFLFIKSEEEWLLTKNPLDIVHNL